MTNKMKNYTEINDKMVHIYGTLNDAMWYQMNTHLFYQMREQMSNNMNITFIHLINQMINVLNAYPY